ncbi:MAG: signal transduction histidine kinase [Bryobacterales bacterium]|nr:signal transduction histidine kinase [Bryobacterales bacterium]
MGNSPIAAFLKDKDGKYVYANRTVDRLIGKGFGQWWNKSDADLWPTDVARKFRENDLRALETNSTIEVSETVPQRNGDRHFLALKFPFATSVGNRYLAGIWLDITDRVRLEKERITLLERERSAREQAETALVVLRQTEARLQRLFDSNVIGIIEINSERILDANNSFLRMIGRERECLESCGLSWRELTPRKYHAIDDLAIQRLLRDGSFQPFEKELLRSDGSVAPVWIGGALLNEPPEWTCVAFVLDLTERKDLEAQFLSGQRLKSLGLLAGGVAHDFNNLLTTIMGNASLSLEALTPEHPAYRQLEEVLRASRMASDLTQQLKVYSGKAGGGAKAVQVSDLVRDISGLIEVAIPRKIDLRLDLEAGLPPIVTDPAQIQQVVLNLVINAADAIGEKPGTIGIATHCRDYASTELAAMTLSGDLPGGPYVSFEVSDTGCGMTDEVKGRIFDPLFTTKARGVGLGLAPVQGIVRSHHGALNVKSKPGQGAVFTVLFPASKEEPKEPDLAAPSDLEGSELVMIVDDEISIRRMAEATLTRFGYRVVTASNGREAVELFGRIANDVSLVILDIAMPEMGGEEALDHMLAIRPEARIVFSSGYNESETMMRLESYGFIPKPYTSRQLAEQIREFLPKKA